MPGPLQLDLYARLQDLAIEETVRVLKLRVGRSFAEVTARFQPAAAEIAANFPVILPPSERSRLDAEAGRLSSGGMELP